MPIIEIVRGTGEEAPHRWTARIGWFLAIWAASTAAFFAVASLLNFLVPK